MDDRRARREAEARGLAIAGTLNVLEFAAKLERRYAVPRLQRGCVRLRTVPIHLAWMERHDGELAHHLALCALRPQPPRADPNANQA